MAKSFAEPWMVVEGTQSKGGGQSFLYCVHRRGESARFALKQEKKRAGRLEREIETMERPAAAGVKSVLPIIESGQHRESTYYVMPWIEEGSLDSAVQPGGR